MKNKQTSTTSWEPNNERMKLLLNSSAKTKEKKKRSSIGRSDEIYGTVIAWLNGKSVCVSSSWVQIVKYPNSHSLVCSVCLQCMLAASDSRVQRAHVGVCKCVSAEKFNCWLRMWSINVESMCDAVNGIESHRYHFNSLKLIGCLLACLCLYIRRIKFS